MSKLSLSEFPIAPVDKHALPLRKLIYGVATNDASYKVIPRVNGKKITCPYYQVWISMITRCYCAKHQIRHPSYVGCTVTNVWLLFSCFRAWMIQQNWQNMQIDKDLLIAGNKLYSPTTCIFVPQHINKLITSHAGVSFDHQSKKYRARMGIDGKIKYLGRFPTYKEAELVYKKAKSAYIRKVATEQSEPLRSALLRHAALIAGNLFIKTRAALSA